MEKEHFEQIWKATGELPDPKIAVDMDVEFARLQSRIAAGGPARVVELRPRRAFLKYAVAASILGLACAAVWYFLPSQPTMLAAGSEAGKTEIGLSDGSHVFVNTGSKLAFPEKFTGPKRLVNLTGEAFFEVAKDATKPFIIETDVAQIRVVGTKFNVKSTADRCEVFVEEGHVVVESNGQKGDLLAGQGAILFKNGAKIQPTARRNAAAWAHDQLLFDNTPLPDALADLSDFYHVKIWTDDAKLQGSRFSWSKPVSGKLDDVLEIIAATFGARVERVVEGEFRLVKN